MEAPPLEKENGKESGNMSRSGEGWKCEQIALLRPLPSLRRPLVTPKILGGPCASLALRPRL